MRVVSYGGGLNTAALLAEAVQRDIPIDLITMADPGSEWQHTIRFRDDHMNPFLERHGYPTVTVCTHTVGKYRTLEEDCLDKRMLPSRAYGFKSCSVEYKIRVQNRYIATLPVARDLWARGEQIERWVGYHYLEQHRANANVHVEHAERYAPRYPLIEWKMGPAENVETLRRAGLPVPGKSSCTFCPSMKPWEVLKLKREEPEALARALAMEARAAERNRVVKGLGRNWSWAELVAYDDAQCDLFVAKEELERRFMDPGDMPCGCYDGDEDDE